jgi:hypothetical protein
MTTIMEEFKRTWIERFNILRGNDTGGPYD